MNRLKILLFLYSHKGSLSQALFHPSFRYYYIMLNARYRDLMTTVCISVAGVVTETNGWGALAGVNLAKWIIFTLGHLLCCDHQHQHQHQLSFINIISHLWLGPSGSKQISLSSSPGADQ